MNSIPVPLSLCSVELLANHHQVELAFTSYVTCIEFQFRRSSPGGLKYTRGHHPISRFRVVGPNLKDNRRVEMEDDTWECDHPTAVKRDNENVNRDALVGIGSKGESKRQHVGVALSQWPPRRAAIPKTKQKSKPRLPSQSRT